MPKKRRTRKPASPHQRRGAGHRSPPSAQLARLQPHLRAWLETDPAMEGADDAEAVLVVLSAVVRLAERSVGLTDLYAWTPDQVHDLLDALEEVEKREARAAGDDPEKIPFPAAMFASALAALVAFIGESGRWRGTVEDRVEVEEVLAEAFADEEEVFAIRDVADAELDEAGVAAQEAAVDAAPLGRMLLELLAWMQPSRPMSDGALSAQVLPEAAALLGAPPGDGEPGSGHGALVVSQALDAHVKAGLVDVRTGVAVPTGSARELLEDPGEHRATLGLALAFFLGGVLLRAEHDGAETAGAGSEPGALAVDLLSVAVIEGEVSAQDVLSHADDIEPVRPLLEELRRFGYLVPGGAVRVTPGLEQVAAEALLMVLDPFDAPDGEPSDDGPGISPAPTRSPS